MSTKFLSPNWRMPRNANQSKQSNYSMDFDNSQQIDSVSNLGISGASPRTFSAWMKTTDSGGGWDVIVATGNVGNTGNNFELDFRSGKITFNDWGTDTFSGATVNDGNWHNICLTYNGTILKLYIDGIEDTAGDFPATKSVSSTDTPVRIGGMNHSAKYFDGQIDGVAIFDYALSPSQITTLYGNSTNGPGNPMALPSTPIAYYPLGESAGGFVGGTGTWLTENNAIGDYVFDFVGTSSQEISLTTSNLPSANSSFSMSVWLNRDSTVPSYAGVLSFGDLGSTNVLSMAYINFDTSNNIKYGFYNGDAGNTAISANNWHHVVLTYNGTNATFYINGQVVGIPTQPGTLAIPTTSTLKIGGLNTSAQTFNGKISNAQIFNAVLSGPEVETLYNYGSPIQTLASIPQSSNLKAWYKLDATEIYNSTSTEWSVDNNQNPSAYPSSLYFDGNTNYISTATLSSFITNDVSVSAWVNFTTLPSSFDGAFLGMNNSFEEGLNFCSVGGVIRFTIEGYDTNYVANTVTLVAGQWYHFCGTWDGSTIELFTNGASQGTFAYNGSISTSRVLEIGRVYNNGYNIDGKISNVAIWNTGLKSAQVTEIYNNGTPSNLSSHSATSNLVSWYKLNNTTTGIEDSKGSNNGTNNGATEYAGFVNTLAGESSGMSQTNLVQSDLQTVAPYSKYALNFDGNDYIDCGNDSSLKLTSNFSVSAWMKSSNQSSFGVAFSIHTIFNLQMSGTLNMFKFNINGVSATYALNPIDDGKWHHVVCTSDGTTARIYVDNVKGNDVSTGATSTTSQPFTIGYLPGNAGLYFNGQISNVSYWSTALTQAQVTETYNEGLPSNLNSHSEYSNLVSWWQLGENSSFNGNDWIVADEIGSNNGESDGMGVDALTNGVGTTANGVSTGMSEGSLVGNAPYSVASTVSSNVAVQEFDPLAPSTVISGRSEDVPS